MQPTHGSSGDGRGGKGKPQSPEPLPPLVSAALEPGGPTLAARIERLNQQRGAKRYTVLGQVGQGGMGRILRVWDELLSREVAMKVVPRSAAEGASDEERADHEQRLARFLDEARITAQLDHPGIVPVYEIGLDDSGSVFFTMPLVRGQDLKHVFALVRSGAEGWTLQRAVDVVRTVCLTVAFAHSKGVVHRDLKPENVMVGPFGEAYVMDWGLALLLGRAERASIVGTPAYMAPEQVAARRGAVGPPADVYSLGALLYELLGGSVPHALSLEARAGEPGSFEQVLSRPPRPLEALADVPPELAAISAKAMARRPAERYAGAREMAEDLAAWLGGKAVRALEAGTWTRFRKWRARNRALALALDSLAAVLVVGGAAFFGQQHVLLREVQAKNEAVRAAAYAASLSAADLGLRAHDSGESRRRLAACDPELRGWEWRHLMLRADASTRVLRGHHGAVRAVVTSPDGRTFASGGDDGAILLWDGATAIPRARMVGHAGFVTGLAFAPDGDRLASASNDKSVRLWSVAEGRAQGVLAVNEAGLTALAFTPDGATLVTGDHDGRVTALRVGDGAVLARAQPETKDTISALAFVPATGELACAHLTGSLRLLAPDDLSVRRAILAAPERLTCLAVDAVGARLAVGHGRTVVVLDALTLAPLRSLDEHEAEVACATFSPDGRRLATGGYDNVLRVFELDSGRPQWELDGHDDELRCAVFLPGGERLVTGSEDASLRVWDLAHAPVERLVEGEKWIEALAFSPEGTELAVGGHGELLRIFELASGRATRQVVPGGIVDGLDWSPHGQLAWASGDSAPCVAPASTLAGRVLEAGAGPPRSLRFDPARRRLFARDSLGAVVVYELDSGKRVATLETGDDQSFTLALAPDGRRIYAGTARGEVLAWDARTLARRAPLWVGTASVEALALAPDGARLAAAQSRSVVLIGTGSGALEHVLEGHESLVRCLAFSPDGTRLVSGSVDGSLRLWDPARAESLLTLYGHESEVTAVSFDPAGERLASASKDGSVRLWSALPRESSSPPPR